MLLTTSCGSNKDVYWCGDHPCLNNKEKKAYFKNVIVEELKSTIPKKLQELDIVWADKVQGAVRFDDGDVKFVATFCDKYYRFESGQNLFLFHF